MDITIRDSVRQTDAATIREIVSSTGFFNSAEIEVAVELVVNRLKKGSESEYFFLFAEVEGRTIGYTCFGPIPGTSASYDLYWIAVSNHQRGNGCGRLLLQKTEQAVKKRHGHRLYIETSSRKQYEPTRAFYEKNGYHLEAQLNHFYARNDAKCIFVKAF
jgi:GNAT superfamily N-acetyltransferase